MRTPPHNPLPSARPRLSVRDVTSSQFEYKKRVYWKNPAKPGRSPDCSANYAPCYCAKKITTDTEGWAAWNINHRVVTTSRCADSTLLSEKQCKETAATLGLTYGGTTPPQYNFSHGCVRRVTTHQPPLPCEAASECAYQRRGSVPMRWLRLQQVQGLLEGPRQGRAEPQLLGGLRAVLLPCTSRKLGYRGSSLVRPSHCTRALETDILGMVPRHH